MMLCHSGAALTAWLHAQKPNTILLWVTSSPWQRNTKSSLRPLQGTSHCLHNWGWEQESTLLCPKACGVGRDVLTRCLVCRGWLRWCTRLRTVLLVPLLIYISVPILIRLFPVLLTKFVYLNFRECPRLGEPPCLEFIRKRVEGSLQCGWGAPSAWVALVQHPLMPPCHGLAEEAWREFLLVPRVLQPVITWCCPPCLLPEVATREHAQCQWG